MLKDAFKESAKQGVLSPFHGGRLQTAGSEALVEKQARPAESSILSGSPFPQGWGEIAQYLLLIVEISCIYVHRQCCS